MSVWCSIINSFIIGPHFLNGTLTGVMYNDFLQNTLPQFLEDVDLSTRQRLWMQQDGDPPHYAHNMQNNFETNVPQTLDRKRWPCKLPPPPLPDCLTLLDLTLLDFFLWGYLKSIG